MPFIPLVRLVSGADPWMRLKLFQVFCGFMHELSECAGVQLQKLKERFSWKAARTFLLIAGNI